MPEDGQLWWPVLGFISVYCTSPTYCGFSVSNKSVPDFHSVGPGRQPIPVNGMMGTFKTPNLNCHFRFDLKLTVSYHFEVSKIYINGLDKCHKHIQRLVGFCTRIKKSVLLNCNNGVDKKLKLTVTNLTPQSWCQLGRDSNKNISNIYLHTAKICDKGFQINATCLPEQSKSCRKLKEVQMRRKVGPKP